MFDQFEEMLKTELTRAKEHYDRVRNTLNTYLADKEKKNPVTTMQQIKRTPKNVINKQVRAAIKIWTLPRDFTPGDIFNAFDPLQVRKLDQSYYKCRSSISRVLDALIEEGVIEKTKVCQYRLTKPKAD